MSSTSQESVPTTLTSDIHTQSTPSTTTISFTSDTPNDDFVNISVTLSSPDQLGLPTDSNPSPSSNLQPSSHSAFIASGSSSSTDLFINSLQLIRELYKQSIAAPATDLQQHNSTVDHNLLNQFSWLLGDASSVPPLLVSSSVQINRDDRNQFLVQFNHINISIHSTAPTQWIDRNGKRFNFGDLILFALQLQTGVNRSQHIAALGHVPFSILMRKPLATVLQDDNLRKTDPTQIAPQHYDASLLTPVQRIDPDRPICVETNEMLEHIFILSPEEAMAKGIVVGGGFRKQQEDFFHRLESRYRLPARQGFIPESLLKSSFRTGRLSSSSHPSSLSSSPRPIVNSTTEKPPTSNPTNEATLVNSSALQLPTSSTLSPTCDSLIQTIELNLTGPHTLLRVDRAFGSHIVRLFDRHLQRHFHPTASPNQKTTGHPHVKETVLPNIESSKRSPSQVKRQPNDQHLRESTPTRHVLSASRSHQRHHQNRSLPYNGENPTSSPLKQPRTLFETLSSRKWKPIIVVPSALTSSLINLDNFKEFLQKQQLPSSDNQHQRGGLRSHPASTIDVPLTNQQQEEYFTWQVEVPMMTTQTNTRHSLSSSSVQPHLTTKATTMLPVEIKIVGDSQVTKFQVDDWYRTIAVIVQGPEWQFKHWPFPNLGAIFNCIRGFYFVYESDGLPSLVEKSPIEVLRLKRTTRHSDITAWTQFVQSIGTILSTPRDFTQFDKAKLKTLKR